MCALLPADAPLQPRVGIFPLKKDTQSDCSTRTSAQTAQLDENPQGGVLLEADIADVIQAGRLQRQTMPYGLHEQSPKVPR